MKRWTLTCFVTSVTIGTLVHLGVFVAVDVVVMVVGTVLFREMSLVIVVVVILGERSVCSSRTRGLFLRRKSQSP